MMTQKTIELREISSFDESYGFQGFKEEELYDDPENHWIMGNFSKVTLKCKCKIKQPPNVAWESGNTRSEKVSKAIKNIEIKWLTDLDDLLKAADIVIAERLWVKQKSEGTTGKVQSMKIRGGKEGTKKVSRKW